jgi:hypothetical protein
MNTKKKWTCVLEFCGGTYVRQTHATSPEEVLGAVLRKVDLGKIPNIKPESMQELREHANEGGGNPVRVKGMRGVYCATLLVGRRLLMAHII